MDSPQSVVDFVTEGRFRGLMMKQRRKRRWISPRSSFYHTIHEHFKNRSEVLHENRQHKEACGSCGRSGRCRGAPDQHPAHRAGRYPVSGEPYFYAFSIDLEVRTFVRSLDKEMVGKIVNFGSAAMLEFPFKKVKAEADKVGIPMDEREFHCKEFQGYIKGDRMRRIWKAAGRICERD